MPAGGAGLSVSRPRYHVPPPPEKPRSYRCPRSSTAVIPPPANVLGSGRLAPGFRADWGEAGRRAGRSFVRAATASQARPGRHTNPSR
jgi:hypothetical protein